MVSRCSKGFLSRPGLSYDLLCFLVLISSMSKCVFSVSKCCKRRFLFVVYLGEKQRFNTTVFCYWLCNRIGYFDGYWIRIEFVGLEWKQLSSSFMGEWCLISLSNNRKWLGSLLVCQWWHLKLGVLDCVFLALGILDQVQVGWRGSYYEAHVKRIDGSYSNQEESGFGFLGERKSFHVGVDGFAYILHDFGGSKSYSFYIIYGSSVISLWRLYDRIWIMLVVSFPVIMGWSRPQRTVNNWSVEIGYHYTHRLSSQEQIKMFFKCGF